MIAIRLDPQTNISLSARHQIIHERLKRFDRLSDRNGAHHFRSLSLSKRLFFLQADNFEGPHSKRHIWLFALCFKTLLHRCHIFICIHVVSRIRHRHAQQATVMTIDDGLGALITVQLC